MIELRRLFVIILFVLSITCIITSCDRRTTNRNSDLRLDYYIDTINGYVILTTVGTSHNDYIGISNVELK